VEEIGYHQFTELEHRHWWFVARRRIFGHLLDSALAGPRPRTVLDVGCGAGGMLELLSRYGEVTGLDVDQEFVDFCHSRGFANTLKGSAYELPAADGSVDLITLFDTLEHLSEDVDALRESRRALRPGGLVFLSSPAYRFLWTNNDEMAHHERRYTAGELRAKLTDAGLAPIKVSYFNTILFPLIVPALLAKQVKESFVDPSETTNLSHTPPPWLNRILAAVMGGERHLLSRRSFPTGHSLLALARRPL